MGLRARKFAGTLATVLWLVIYALVAMAVGGQLVVGHGLLVELPYYVIAGVAWLPVEMMIIRWMSKPEVKPH